MTTLLASSTATNAAAQEGHVKTFLDNLRTYIADLLGTDSTDKAAVLGLLGAVLNSKVDKTGAYTVVGSDRGKVINCSGTWTLSITAAATLGDGFAFAVRNSGSGIVTIDPNLSEQINAKTSEMVAGGDFLIVYCDGVGFSTVGGSRAQSGGQVFTSSGTFTVPPGVTSAKVTVIGGGGSGQSFTYPDTGNGTGGTAGGFGTKFVTGLTPSGTVSVTVGGAGEASSFGSHISCTGGGYAGAPSGTCTGASLSIEAVLKSWNGGSSHNGQSLDGWGIGGIGGDASGYGNHGSAAIGYGAGGGGSYAAGWTVSGGSGGPGVVIVEW